MAKAEYKTLRKFSHAKTNKTYEVGDKFESDADFTRALKKGFVEHIGGKLPEPKAEVQSPPPKTGEPGADGRGVADPKATKADKEKAAAKKAKA